MAALVIRAASVKDISSIVRIRLAAVTKEEIRGFSAPEFATYTSIKELRKAWGMGNKLRDGFEVFVAEAEGRPAGFIVFRVERGYGYIDNLIVSKEEQRKGVGRALVAYVEGIARSKGCSLMKTDTTENAEGVPWKSYSFWTRMGYQDTGDRLPTDYDFREIPFIKKLT